MKTNFLKLFVLISVLTFGQENTRKVDTLLAQSESKSIGHATYQGQFDLAYQWQSLKGKKIKFIITENSSNQSGFVDFFMRKDLKIPYAVNDEDKTDAEEMIGKNFKVLNVEENYRNRNSEIGVLLFLENLKPSHYLKKHLYYMYVPGTEQPFMFEVLD